jgi:hypothetical protein
MHIVVGENSDTNVRSEFLASTGFMQNIDPKIAQNNFQSHKSGGCLPAAGINSGIIFRRVNRLGKGVMQSRLRQSGR